MSLIVRSNNPILIAIHGKPHSGKDSICNEILKYLPLERFGPSVPVKEAASTKFQVPINYFYDEKLKETVIPFWGLTPREMAQYEGKEGSRDIYGDDFWMKRVELYLHNKDPFGNTLSLADKFFCKKGIILADIRYENEVHWARKNGGIVLFVTRDNKPIVTNESHPAEHGLPEYLADYIIRNNGTLEQLRDKVPEFLELYNLLDRRYI